MANLPSPLMRPDRDIKDLEDTLHAVLPDFSHERDLHAGQYIVDQEPVSSRSSASFEASGPATPVLGEPQNFAQVQPGLYRSSFPRVCNFPYLSSLKLRTIVTLVSTDEPDYEPFIEAHGITHYRIEFPAHKEDGKWIPDASMREVLSILQEEANYPLLVHCNKGKHRTGCAVACHRMLNGWSKDDIIYEYQKYAGDKARALDEKYIREIVNPKGICPTPVKEPSTVQTVKAAKAPYPTPPSSDRSIRF